MACDKCRNSKMAPFIINEAGVVDLCDCEKSKLEAEIDSKLQAKSGIDRKYWNQSLSVFRKDFYPKPHIATSVSGERQTRAEIIKLNEPFFAMLHTYTTNIRQFMSGEKHALWVFSRNPISGKTTSATLIGTSAARANIRVKYFNIVGLQQFLQNFEKQKEEPIDVFVSKYDLFIIDDLLKMGVCPIQNEYIRSCLLDLLERVISCGKYLIITANVPLIEVEAGMQHVQSILFNNVESFEIHGSLQAYL